VQNRLSQRVKAFAMKPPQKDFAVYATVASWFRYLTGLDESGKEMPMPDPNGPDIAGTREGCEGEMSDTCEVLREELATSPAFLKEVSDTLQSFYEDGVMATLVKSIA
jgi:mannitol-1-phosphate/altronate dehydrogenase